MKATKQFLNNKLQRNCVVADRGQLYSLKPAKHSFRHCYINNVAADKNKDSEVAFTVVLFAEAMSCLQKLCLAAVDLFQKRISRN